MFMSRRKTGFLHSHRRILAIASLVFCWTIFHYQPTPASLSTREPAVPAEVEDLTLHPLDDGLSTIAEDEAVEELLDAVALQTNETTTNIPWLVAILPVTELSIPFLDTSISVFLEQPGILNELVLLSPPAMHESIRDALGRVFPEESMHLLDVSIAIWPEGLEEGAASLYTARQLSSDRILFVDSTGLGTIDIDTREMILGPIATPLPVGPRGFNRTDGQYHCILATEKPQAADFLLPPFSVSSVLVPPHTVDLSPVYDVWSSLGQHIAHARFERVGGVAVSGSTPAAEEWCSGRQPGLLLSQSPHSTPANNTADTAPQLPVSNDADETLVLADEILEEGPGSVIVVLPRLDDFLALANTICRMKNQTYELSFAVVEDTQDQAESYPVNLKKTCDIEVTALNATQQDALPSWMSSLPPPRVILRVDSEEVAFSSHFLAAKQRYPSSVLINVPRKELPYCDWIGSLTFVELRNWNLPKLDISIITNDRPESLSRLLLSLSNGLFFGDTANLRINVEQTADFKTLDVVDRFAWKLGAKSVHRRVIHGGLLPSVVESWYPGSNNSYGLLLEDDVELSPLFYAWIKMTLLRYRYGAPENRSPDLFGISLYQQKNLELRPEGRHRFNAREVFGAANIEYPNTPFLSQIPCSWGAVYFPEHWREFHEYLSIRLSGRLPELPTGQVIVPGVRSNRWTHSWKKYFIELVFLRGYVMLYPNYEDYKSLSTNHLEIGSHVKVVSRDVYERKKKLFLLPLLELPVDADAAHNPTSLMDLPMGHVPAWTSLPVTDLFGLLTSSEALKGRGSARRRELFGCAAADSSSLSITSDIRELLCYVDHSRIA